MKDYISLIPPEHIINDKHYGNIADLALRTDILSDYLALCGKGGREKTKSLSDYDILRAFVECVRERGDRSSRAYLYFERVLQNTLDVSADDLISGRLSVDELWMDTAEKLVRKENTLRQMICRSTLDSLGVAVEPWEYKKMPERIGNTRIEPVICPLGVKGYGVLDNEHFSGLGDFCRHIDAWSEIGGCAVLLGELDFEFEKPNPYTAALAYDKIVKGLPIKTSEQSILKSQLLREVILGLSERGREIFLVLAGASNIKNLYQTEQLIKYIDESAESPVRLTLFARDAVGFSFALSNAAKCHKKITADVAICDSDCYFITESEIGYLGVGGLPDRRASLASTPAPFGRIE